MQDRKYKFFSFITLLIFNTVCAVSAVYFNLETTGLKIIGSFFAVVLPGLLLHRFPLKFYCFMNVFVFFSSSLGSCVNLYYYISDYDTIIHFLSGIILAEGGKLFAEKIINKRELKNDLLMLSLFALLFSCTCAAVWEIYEYAVDVTLGANMQGSKENTMNDIIAGVSGALVYLIVNFITDASKKNKENVKAK